MLVVAADAELRRDRFEFLAFIGHETLRSGTSSGGGVEGVEHGLTRAGPDAAVKGNWSLKRGDCQAA